LLDRVVIEPPSRSGMTKPATKKSGPCPCESGASYAECCQPALSGAREPVTAEALMRSRYVAFQTGAVDHLIRTLHADHPDRALGEEALRVALLDARRARRLLGLRVLEARESRGPCDGVTAQVLFYARAFHKGRDVSFVELSDFVHDGTGFRYRDGTLLDAPRGAVAGTPVDQLTIDEFRRRCST
jgi:SEC-C motif domain protein